MSFANKWLSHLGQRRQLAHELIIGQVVEKAMVEVDILRQQRGNHCQIRFRLLVYHSLNCRKPAPLPSRKEIRDTLKIVRGAPLPQRGCRGVAQRAALGDPEHRPPISGSDL
jgi:hypothetical protein